MTRRAFVVLLPLAFAAAGCRQAETLTLDQQLSARIEQLLDNVLMPEDEAAKASALSAAREIFEREGVLGTAHVGDAAAYGFVAVMFAQPTDVQQRFYKRLQQADARASVPADALVFADAMRRQKAVEERFKTQEPTRPDVRDQIERLIKDDQAARQTEGFDVEKMAAADRRTAGPLKAMLDQHGVPTYDMVGVAAARDFVILVQHMTPEFRSAVLPKLKVNVDAGQADPGVYALVYDRTQRDQGKNQLYGQQLECNKANVIDVAPLDDAAGVNMRRAKLGLMRVEIYTRVIRRMSPACTAFGHAK